MDNYSISNKQLEDLLENLAAKHRDAIDEKIDQKNSNLMTILQKQGAAITALSEQPGAGSGPASLKEIMTSKGVSFDDLKSGKTSSVKIELSAPEVKTLVQRSSIGSSTQAYRLGNIAQLDYDRPRLRDLFAKGTVGSNSGGVVRYVDETSITRNANNVAEAGSKPESAATWTESSQRIEKLADSFSCTMEALEDYDFMQNEIRRLLTVNLALKEDQQLYHGSGTTPQLQGILSICSSYDYFGPTFTAPTVIDLIAAVRTEIASTSAKYSNITCLINPVDLLAAQLDKGSDGHYIKYPDIGVNIIESAQVSQNTLVIGDFNYSTLYDCGPTTISVGWVNSQFMENKITILGEKRLSLVTRQADRSGFYKVNSISGSLTEMLLGS